MRIYAVCTISKHIEVSTLLDQAHKKKSRKIVNIIYNKLSFFYFFLGISFKILASIALHGTLMIENVNYWNIKITSLSLSLPSPLLARRVTTAASIV